MGDRVFTTNQAATELGVTPVRVRALIRDGRLLAEKFGRDYLIKEVDLDSVRHRKPGRPPKNTPPKE
jgi:excisionase family DNA binding protein